MAGVLNSASSQAQEMCGGSSYPFPYTDVSGVGPAFCPGIMEAYVTGVSKGTSPSTFSPNENVSRVQMTTFLQRSLDQGLTRTSRRGALNQWWTRQYPTSAQTIAVGYANACAADGEDIWIGGVDVVVQMQANTGKVLGTWTGLDGYASVVVAADKVFASVYSFPAGILYQIDPTQSPGAATQVANTLGPGPVGIAFDGIFLWTANQAGGEAGSVSGIETQAPYTVFTATAGFVSPTGILYDGSNIWVTDSGASKLFKLELGSIVQTVTVGKGPENPAFDGVNIWVPNSGDDSITVVQASTGTVVATITANASNQLNLPSAASFDGERILVTNQNGNSVTVFKAADLSFIANVPTGPGTNPWQACSDGINFFVPLLNTSGVLRF
jgi:YVTN family beta-propeller protein